MKPVRSGGGWQAIRYVLAKAWEVGGPLKLYRALRSRNACKTCALGMGGQRGGMVNEQGRFPEVCKKSVQAMVADMQDGISSEFFQEHAVSVLSAYSPRELEASGRLVEPLLLSSSDDHYHPISWPEAFALVVGHLKSADARETFWYASGRSSNEAGFLLQLFARMYGTNNVNNCSYYCHQASGVGLTGAVGTSTATVVLDDVEGADLVFVVGGNPASNHPRLMRSLMQVRRRGGQVIVVNPVIEAGLVNFRVPSDWRSLLFGSPIASLYVQPHIGGDLALLHGIAKRVVELEAHDPDFLADHCAGWPEYRVWLRTLAWEEIEKGSGVAREVIDDVARRYAACQGAIFSWTMGITHHSHGVENVEAIANLALLRGMVGKRYAGLLPIRGHSNVQGVGSVGVTPRLREVIFQRLQEHFGVRLPTEPGMDTMACLEAAAVGKLKFGLCLGGNLYGASPDAAFTASALANLDLLVYVSTTLNTGHVHGLGRQTLILPALARDEEPLATTQESMFNYVRLSDGGRRRHRGPKSEIEIIARLAEGVLGGDGPIEWRRLAETNEVRQAIAAVVPGYEKLAGIAESRQEFQIDGRTLHEPRFPTPDGKARLFTHWFPEPVKSQCLRLMTVRSEGQFNTVVYEEEDLYRGQERRDVILIHPEDAASLGFSHDQPVDVLGPSGMLKGIRVRCFDRIKPGNALMYYPEANILIPRQVDPRSRTPAFKGATVTLRAGKVSPVDREGSSAASARSRGARSLKAC